MQYPQTRDNIASSQKIFPLTLHSCALTGT